MLVRTDAAAVRTLGDTVRTVATELTTQLSEVDEDLAPPSSANGALPAAGAFPATEAAVQRAAADWSTQLSLIADQLTLTGAAIIAAANGYAEAELRAEQRHRAGAAGP